MSIMCDRDPHLLLPMPGVRGITDLHQKILHPHQLRWREENQNPNVSGDARRAQEEANHDAAAQEDEDDSGRRHGHARICIRLS